MEKDQESPFPREPWQRLLQDRADAPPETTDARIRAAARKTLPPRAARWWLPASLAASFLLAVLIVQSQFGNEKKPAVVTEKDLALPAAPAPSTPANSPDLARERAADSAAAVRKESTPSELHYEVAPEEIAPELEADPDEERVATSGARVSGPEQDLKDASEMDAEPIEQPAPPRAEAQSNAAVSSGITGMTAEQPAAKPRTPEAWYAEIKALRKAGRNEEADAELARFQAAYPDWLKQHRRRKP